jgi:hypothetical protein
MYGGKRFARSRLREEATGHHRPGRCIIPLVLHWNHLHGRGSMQRNVMADKRVAIVEFFQGGMRPFRKVNERNGVVGSQLNNAFFSRYLYGVVPVFRLQLLVTVLDMGMNGVGAYAQLLTDLFIGKSLFDELDNFFFP